MKTSYLAICGAGVLKKCQFFFNLFHSFT